MLKKLRYIKDSFTFRFSKEITACDSKVKWIIYNISQSSLLSVINSTIIHCGFSILGKNNKVEITNGALMGYTNVLVFGDNNHVIFDGCRNIVSLTVRGNGCNVSIGKDTTFEKCLIICMGNDNSITIGECCMFSGDIEIWNTDSHPIFDVAQSDNQNSQDYIKQSPINPSLPVKIGNHVWVGKYVKILKGITIGDNSVIGMGSVVTHDIPAGCIAVGNPAKVIKENINWDRNFITV